MVKRGGTKREYLATTFIKRCYGLHSKGAQLCLLSDAQIAILATPPSSQSNVSFFSFGHPSVDSVVNAYLTGQRLAPVWEDPRAEDIGILMARKELGLELWWEKESLSKSKNPQELMGAVKAMDKVLCKLREFLVDNNERDSHHQCNENNNNKVAKSDVVLQAVDETLTLQATCCVPDDDDFDKIAEDQDQILAICDSFCATDKNINGLIGSLDVYCQEKMDIDELIDWMTIECSALSDGFLDSTQELHGSRLMNFEAAHDISTNLDPPIFGSECVEEEALVFENKASDEAANDVSTNQFPICDFEGAEEEGFVLQNRALDVENLKFSDNFN